MLKSPEGGAQGPDQKGEKEIDNHLLREIAGFLPDAPNMNAKGMENMHLDQVKTAIEKGEIDAIGDLKEFEEWLGQFTPEKILDKAKEAIEEGNIESNKIGLLKSYLYDAYVELGKI